MNDPNFRDPDGRKPKKPASGSSSELPEREQSPVRRVDPFANVKEDTTALRDLDLLPLPGEVWRFPAERSSGSSEASDSEEENDERENPTGKFVDLNNPQEVMEYLWDPENDQGQMSTYVSDIFDRFKSYIPEWEKLAGFVGRKPASFNDLETNFRPNFETFLQKKAPKVLPYAEQLREYDQGDTIGWVMKDYYSLPGTVYEP